MTAHEQIKSRFGFSLPEDYLRFLDAGLLEETSAKGLVMSRFGFLLPHQIAGTRLPDYAIKQLVPCARTGGGDYFCWYVPETGDCWVGDCPRDSNIATGYAPSFEAFVFRALLEDFEDDWLVEDVVTMSRKCMQNVEHLHNVMRREWVDTLRELASQPAWLNAYGRAQVISSQEMRRIINTELAFSMLDKEFVQFE